jgi:hypothetical protein
MLFTSLIQHGSIVVFSQVMQRERQLFRLNMSSYVSDDDDHKPPAVDAEPSVVDTDDATLADLRGS